MKQTPYIEETPTSPKQDDNRNHIYIYQAKTENQSKKKGLEQPEEIRHIMLQRAIIRQTNLQHKW